MVNSIARYEKSGRLAQIQSDLNKSQLNYFEATDLALQELIFGRHRAGDVLRLSDGGCLFLNLFSNDRVGRAAQRLGVRASFWNLKYGTQLDVTHPVNLRRLLRDIADGGILGCMMSVPSAAWNAARNNDHPLRSHSQPWGIEESKMHCR